MSSVWIYTASGIIESLWLPCKRQSTLSHFLHFAVFPVQRGEMQNPAPGEEQPTHPYKLRADQLESNPQEKDLRVLMDTKLNMSQ